MLPGGGEGDIDQREVEHGEDSGTRRAASTKHSLTTQGEVTDVSPELCHHCSALVSHISAWSIAAHESIALNTARHRHRAFASSSHRRWSSVWSADHKTCFCVRAPASIMFITMHRWCRSWSSSRTFASAVTSANFRHARGMTQPWVTHRAISYQMQKGCCSRVCVCKGT